MQLLQPTAEDIPSLAAVLGRAFADDPVTRWCYRKPARWGERFFDWQLRRLLDQDVTWTTEGRDGAAIWALPDRWREGTGDLLRLARAVFPGLGPRIPRVLRGLSKVEARHPEERHLYLAVLGVEPALQGQGVGSRLLGPGLALCDTEGLPAYLETATERNVVFYNRHGFDVTDRIDLPNGPPVWLMWRAPT